MKVVFSYFFFNFNQGSDPNCVNKNGIPALHIAAKNKWADCISVLVDGGAEVDKKGPTAM